MDRPEHRALPAGDAVGAGPVIRNRCPSSKDKWNEGHIFENNPFIEGLFEYMESPRGQLSDEVGEVTSPLLENLDVDAVHGKLLWEDGKRLSIKESDMSTMPTLFMPHGGGPCFFMDWDPPDTWDRMAAYLRGIPADVGRRPEAIVLISAHWEEEIVTIQNNPAPPLLFDYCGFPENTYRIEYPVSGSSEHAARISMLLEQAGVASQYDSGRGFDHGVFIPLKIAFPHADIPIVQVSLRSDLDPSAHIELGTALRPLRDEGVLIMGSGMTNHNMRTMMNNMRGSPSATPASERFDEWLTEVLTRVTPEARERSLVFWENAPDARLAHPREEHLLPLHTIVGAAGSDKGRRMLKDCVLGTVQSAFQFG